MSLPVINTTGTHRKPDNIFGSPPDSLVVIVSSIGAAEEISTVLRSLSTGAGAGFLVLPDVRLGFSRLLCERLQVDCSLPVYEAGDQASIARGEVFVTPAQATIALSRTEDGTILLHDTTESEQTSDNSSRLVKILRSAGEIFRQELTVVVLSGMEGDIVAAAAAAKDLGGRILAQSAATTLIHDAPHAIVEASLADDVLPLWAIGGRITDLLESRR